MYEHVKRGPWTASIALRAVFLSIVIGTNSAGCSSDKGPSKATTDGGSSEADRGGKGPGSGGVRTGTGGANGTSGNASGGQGASTTGGRTSVLDASTGTIDAAEASTPTRDANAADTRVDSNHFQQALIHALCDNVQACCAAASRAFDPANCRRTVVQQFVVALSDTTLTFDSAAAGRCIDAVSRAAQACASVDVTPCYSAFLGPEPAGAACASSFECAAGSGGFAICLPDALCAQPKRGKLGDECSFTCIESGGGERCIDVPFAAGSNPPLGACHSENGLACVAPATGTAKCQPVSTDCRQNPDGSCPTGQLCDLTSDRCYLPAHAGQACASTPCDPSSYCASGVCTAQKPNAAQCTSDAECQSHKCDNGQCVVYSKAAAEWCGERLFP